MKPPVRKIKQTEASRCARHQILLLKKLFRVADVCGMGSSAMQQRLKQQIDIIFAFRKTLTPETDRGCALMAAAYLDSQLERLLMKRFVDNPATANELLGLSKPLSSFSSRIDLAFLLGCIGEKEKRDLHLIRKIRNEFGHDPSPITFEHPQIASRCRELYYSWHEAAARPRACFTSAVFAVLATIHAMLLKSSHAPIAASLHFSEKEKRSIRTDLQTIVSEIAEKTNHHV